MGGALTPTRVFIGATLAVAVGLASSWLEIPGATLLTEVGLVAATSSATLITFGREAATGGVRRLAGAYLWLLFFSPFVAVGSLLALGADPLSTFLAAVVGFSALLVLAVVAALTLAVHSAYRRHARKASA